MALLIETTEENIMTSVAIITNEDSEIVDVYSSADSAIDYINARYSVKNFTREFGDGSEDYMRFECEYASGGTFLLFVELYHVGG